MFSDSDTFGSNVVSEGLDKLNPELNISHAFDYVIGAVNDLDDAGGFF